MKHRYDDIKDNTYLKCTTQVSCCIYLVSNTWEMDLHLPYTNTYWTAQKTKEAEIQQ